MPKTGRTHQLRAHLRAIDRPIVMDGLYAERKIPNSNNLGLKRMSLHAHILEIVLPNGSKERFVSPLPKELDTAADLLAGE